MHIFISYSNKDRLPAQVVANDLRRCGHSVWLDQNEIRGGQKWWDEILEAIRHCEIFVQVVTTQSLASFPCKQELHYATALNRHILPVLLEEINIKLVAPHLSTLHMVNYVKQDKESLLVMIEAMNAAPIGTPLPDPMPIPPEVPISPLGKIQFQIEKASLDLSEQTLILAELKSLVVDSDDLEEIGQIANALKKRHDLFATLVKDIDDLAVSIKNKVVVTQDILITAYSNVRASPPTNESKLLGVLPAGLLTSIVQAPSINGYVQLAETYSSTTGWVLEHGCLRIPNWETETLIAVKTVLVYAAPATLPLRILGHIAETKQFNVFKNFWWGDYKMLTFLVNGETGWVIYPNGAI